MPLYGSLLFGAGDDVVVPPAVGQREHVVEGVEALRDTGAAPPAPAGHPGHASQPGQPGHRATSTPVDRGRV